MFKPRPCGCKGIRTCLVCEADFGIEKLSTEPDNGSLEDSLEFCHLCSDKAWRGKDVWREHPNHNSLDKTETGFPFPGVYLQPDFITADEEAELVAGCDQMEWNLSQSGRRKQNFGPKTNFKKKKISGTSFQGFPVFSQKFQQKLNQVRLLSDFITIEQCAIEYRPDTGACIDPHIDDCWVWGERVISINLLSPSTLTMTKYRGTLEKYNLNYHYNNISEKSEQGAAPPNVSCEDPQNFPVVRIPMPARSLLVLYGPARYQWLHSVLRKDITSRRICMAYREFTPQYLPHGEQYEKVGKSIIDKSKNYFSIEIKC